MMMRHRPAQVGLILLSLSACVGPEVRTDFDPGADFAKFKTYAFAELTDVSKGGMLDNSLMRKRLDQMVGQQLTNKGLQQVGLDQNPDLLVNYWVGVKEKQQIESTGGRAGMYAGPRGGGYGWGAGYGGGVTTYEYKEGTLAVDLVEAAKKELVWRATIVATLEDRPDENLELANQGITKAFQDYPPGRK